MTLSVVARRVGLSPRFDAPGAADAGAARLHGLQGSALPPDGENAGSLAIRNCRRCRFVSLMQPRLAARPRSSTNPARLSCSTVSTPSASRASAARRLERDYMGVWHALPAHATSSGKILLRGNDRRAGDGAVWRKRHAAIADSVHVTKLSVLLDDVRKARRTAGAHISQETALGLESISCRSALMARRATRCPSARRSPSARRRSRNVNLPDASRPRTASRPRSRPKSDQPNLF